MIPTPRTFLQARPERDTVDTHFPANALRLEITGTEAKSARARLDDAITLAESMARKEGRCGVLVTHHDYGRFSVTISPEVPCGTTQEAQDWASNTNGSSA